MLTIAIFLAIFASSFAQVFPRDECDKACYFLLSPVCASNGMTYANKCVLEIAMCKDDSIKLVHDGECSDICKEVSPCPRLYDPVCGTDGKTYNNDCLFRKAVCNNRELEKAHKGRCKESEMEQKPYSYFWGP